MEIKSIYRYARTSAQKTRLVINLIKGKKAFIAMNILNFTKKKSATLIKKTLKSAISNAKHNNNINANDLIIKKIFVDEGPRMKRIFHRAKGRSDNIIKKTSHITIILSKK